MNSRKRLLRWASGIMLALGTGLGPRDLVRVRRVLLVPSPFFAGIISGALIILAARSEDRSEAARDRETDLA